MLSFLNPLFAAVAWVMMQIHGGLSHLFGASSGVTWGLSIVILVVLMRLIMVPLFIKQRNSMQKMQSHTPQLQELRKKYKHDKQKLNEETMKFYKENGINPLGGCLPLVAQMPVFWALFQVLEAIAQWTPGHPTKFGLTTAVVTSARDAHVFGVSLADNFLHPLAAESTTSRIVILLFVLVSAGTTFLTMWQSKRRGMMNQTVPDPDQPGAAAAQAMSKNMMYIAPFFALTGLYWQFGLVIYWVTTNVWTLGQQHFLFRKLPVVGSATVGASAVQAASGNTGTAARNSAAAKTGTAAGRTGSASARTGTTARPGTAAKAGTAAARTGSASARTGATARPGTAAKTGTAAAKTGTAAAKTGTKPTADGKPTNSAKPASKSGTPSSAAPKAPAANANGATAVNGAAANGAATNGATTSGSGLLRRFVKKEEPQDVPVAPQAKIVRQQPVRQTRSKRGNTGKR
ncbi:MAG: membrane protein insertase YidC [Trebonia sp.]